MLFATIVSFLSIAAFVAPITASQPPCSEAARFGIPRITPDTGLRPNSTIHIATDFRCSFALGVKPKLTMYQTSVGSRGAAVILASRDPKVTAKQPWDNFTIQVPDAYWTANTTYGITLWTYFDVQGPNGGYYLSEGGVAAASITINSTTPAKPKPKA